MLTGFYQVDPKPQNSKGGVDELRNERRHQWHTHKGTRGSKQTRLGHAITAVGSDSDLQPKPSIGTMNIVPYEKHD